MAELLILVGVVGVMVAVFLQKVVSPPLLVASIAAVAIGTFEVTLREHLGGYRSHTVLLAVVPVVVLHSAVLLVAGAFTSVPRWVEHPAAGDRYRDLQPALQTAAPALPRRQARAALRPLSGGRSGPAA